MPFTGTRTGYYTTRSLDGHVRLIQQQFRKSLADAETVKLARRIVAGVGNWVVDPSSGQRVHVVEAWGRQYRMPERPEVGRMRDDETEIKRIWNFMVLNVRYVLDTDGVDVFSTVRETLEGGSGDCDDFSITACALLAALGFQTAVRVISTDRQAWEHVFPLVATPKEGAKKVWIPLDPTVAGKKGGWQYDASQGGASRDFMMTT